jgi:hypothetical protein
MSENTRYIILTHRKPEDAAARIDNLDEINFVFAHFIGGPIGAINSRADGPGSFIELNVESEEEALAFARELPAVKAGIEKALVIPLRAYAPFVALAEAWD